MFLVNTNTPSDEQPDSFFSWFQKETDPEIDDLGDVSFFYKKNTSIIPTNGSVWNIMYVLRWSKMIFGLIHYSIMKRMTMTMKKNSKKVDAARDAEWEFFNFWVQKSYNKNFLRILTLHVPIE